MALLANLLVQNRLLERVAEFLEPRHFSVDFNGRLFEAISKLVAQGRSASPVTLKAYFKDDPALADLGGDSYLARLGASAISFANTEDYGRQIFDLARRRELALAALDLFEDAVTPDLDRPADLIAQTHEERLYKTLEAPSLSGGLVSAQSAAEAALRAAERAWKAEGKLLGVTTGLVDLDRQLGGLHPGNLVILAARTSMGKSAMAVNIAEDAAKRFAEEAGGAAPKSVAFFSLEMNVEEIGQRLHARRTGLSAHKTRSGQLASADFDRLIEATADIGRDVPSFHIDETGALGLPLLRQRVRRLARKQPLGLVVVDYLQLMWMPKGENRNIDLGDLSMGLKQLAKEFKVPVLALSQLSRALESREDKRPMLSDLRESGSLEQNADVVLFIFREEYYVARAEPPRKSGEAVSAYGERLGEWQQRCAQIAHKAEILVAKNRQGPLGTVLARWDGEASCFQNWARAAD